MRIVLLLAILGLWACAPDAERIRPTQAAGPHIDAVTGLMAAFNDHDADKMREYWHDDVTWIEVTGNGVSVVTESAEQLHNELLVYFESYPEVSASLESISVNGDYLTAIERPEWQEGGVKKTQASIVIYEFDAGKVKRFWYYPPQ